MADSSKAGRVVFIGNIPYGLTEEQIVHQFGSVGQVLNFRLVYDQDTGRPKGFGFCEFADTDSASSAVRNLNGFEIMGRELRVDFSHVGGKEPDATAANHTNPLQQQPPPPIPSNGFQPPPSGALPPLPPGVDLPAGLTCPDAISKTLSTLAPAQLLEILSQMKGLVMGDPAKATQLLGQAPQLAYAIFQALLLMGLVDTSVLASVVETGNQAALPQPPPQPPQQLPPRPTTGYPPPPPQQYQYPQVQNQMHVPTPPIYQQPYQPPPMPPQHQPPQQSQSNEQELLKQVLAMTPQQIEQLPPTERGQILDLRARMGVR